MARFSLHAVGKDRPGIIAGVASALVALGANLEDSRMTILQGQFSMMLVLEAPGIADGGLIEGALEQCADELNLFIMVRPLPEDHVSGSAGPRYTISVDGADRPGMVAGITAALAALNANVVELVGRIFDSGTGSNMLRLSVVLPEGVDAEGLAAAVGEVSRSLGVTSTITSGGDELM